MQDILETSLLTYYWYLYEGPEAPNSEFFKTSNYHKYIGNDPFMPCDYMGHIPCAIYALGGDSTYPYPFTATLNECIKDGTARAKNYAVDGVVVFYVRGKEY